MPLIGLNFGGIMLSVGSLLPIALWIQRGFLASIPPGLAAQAMVASATRFPAFLHNGLPLAAAGVISTTIFVFLMAWDELL
jgi:ABC-type glycerol-3-phosphate transport system permease component